MASLEIEVDVSTGRTSSASRPGRRSPPPLDAYPDLPLAAHVITTIPAADRQRATVRVRIGFDALDPRILPDMGVKVAFLAPAPPAGAAPRPVLLVPRAAVRGMAGAEHVFVVADNRVERRPVRPAPGAGDPVAIESGLAAGELGRRGRREARRRPAGARPLEP